MRQQIISLGIVLARTDFQEADRILTFITPDHGKQRVISKGVRRQRSKLAGGIELFSISDITILPGRGELGTLLSARLKNHYGNVVKDIRRTMLGYEMLKRMNKLTEDAAGREYFDLLQAAFEGLNNSDLSVELVELWYSMQLLKITGHSPNLRTDVKSNPLRADKKYIFDFDSTAFSQQSGGSISPRHIKLMRLGSGLDSPLLLKQVTDADEFASETLKLVNNILRLHVRI